MLPSRPQECSTRLKVEQILSSQVEILGEDHRGEPSWVQLPACCPEQVKGRGAGQVHAKCVTGWPSLNGPGPPGNYEEGASSTSTGV